MGFECSSVERFYIMNTYISQIFHAHLTCDQAFCLLVLLLFFFFFFFSFFFLGGGARRIAQSLVNAKMLKVRHQSNSDILKNLSTRNLMMMMMM